MLRVFENSLAKSFYIDWLGFQLDWEHRNEGEGPSIMEVSRGRATLHLSEHYGDGSPGAKVIVDDIEALHGALNQRRNLYMRPGVEISDWGAKVMAVIDPFGNRLVFVQK